MPITPWPHYADHPLALICRSPLGSYMPVGDTQLIATCRGGDGLTASAPDTGGVAAPRPRCAGVTAAR